MAKKGTTIRLSDDIWEEIEQYMINNKLDNKNIAVERMLFERRILSNFMNTLNNLNITVSGVNTQVQPEIVCDKDESKDEDQEERIKNNMEVQNALDKSLDDIFSSFTPSEDNSDDEIALTGEVKAEDLDDIEF